MLGCFLICVISLNSILVPEILSPICVSALCIRTVIRYGRVTWGRGGGVRWREHALEADDSVLHPIRSRVA